MKKKSGEFWDILKEKQEKKSEDKSKVLIRVKKRKVSVRGKN